MNARHHPSEQGLHFVPIDPPRTMFDQVLSGPVLKLGAWCNADGHEVLLEVCTMVLRRRPLDLRDFPPAPARTAKEDADVD
jgi:hypothetical protein